MGDREAVGRGQEGPEEIGKAVGEGQRGRKAQEGNATLQLPVKWPAWQVIVKMDNHNHNKHKE